MPNYFENPKKREINDGILNDAFPDISEDNPVSADKVYDFLKDFPGYFDSYNHKNYNEFSEKRYKNIDQMIWDINNQKKEWEQRQIDKEKLSAKNFDELDLENIDAYLKKEQIGLNQEEVKNCFKEMIGDQLLPDLNIGRMKFSPTFILDKMSIIDEPLTEEEFLSNPENLKQKSRGGTQNVLINKRGDKLFIDGNVNDMRFHSLKYEDYPSYLDKNDKNWLKKYFMSGFVHEFIHCAVNDLLTIQDMKEFEGIMREEEKNGFATSYVESFYKEERVGGNVLEDQLTELGRLYVLDFNYIDKKFPKQTEWFSKKFPSIKKDYLKNRFGVCDYQNEPDQP